MMKNNQFAAIALLVICVVFSASTFAIQANDLALQKGMLNFFKSLNSFSPVAALMCFVFGFTGLIAGRFSTGITLVGMAISLFIAPTVLSGILGIDQENKAVVKDPSYPSSLNSMLVNDSPHLSLVVAALIVIAIAGFIYINYKRTRGSESQSLSNGIPSIGDIQEQNSEQGIPPIEEMRTTSKQYVVANEIVVEKNKRKIVI